MDSTFESGGGFRTCSVVYEVNPVGSKHLYRLVSVNRKGNQVDLETVLRLNAPDGIDEAISAKFKSYASEVQQQPIAKRIKKKVEPPKSDPSQFEMSDL